MTETTFGFQWTTVSLLVSVAAILFVCALSWLNWQRSGRRGKVLVLELLRIAIVLLCVFLLNQPETVQEYKPSEKPVLAILADQSLSMDTRDAELVDKSSSASGGPIGSRREALNPLLLPETWSELEDQLDVVISDFSGLEEKSRTNMHAAISNARRENGNLRAMVIASDGDWNEGEPPVQAAMQLRVEKIPIFSVPIGSPTRLPDLELVSFDVPTFGVTGKNVRIPFTIESSLPRDAVADLELTVSDGSIIKHQVRIAAMGRTSDALIWKPEVDGDYTLKLTVPTNPDEQIKDNNSRETPIVIRQERLRVLVVETLPRWEYRYLRNALSRDPGVEVHCLLFHPGLSKVGGGNRDYIPEFPDQLDQLAQYDVVFLGDVGIADKQLSEEQCRLLKGLVQQQASGLVFMPGLAGHMATLVDSPLEPLLPVTFDDTQLNGWGARTPSHFALTELGQRSLLTKLADTQDENLQVWENLPGFQWHAPIVRAKAGADILAVHQDASNEYGRIPLLVTKTFGAGKVLFMGTDGAWRWRRGVEDLYHYRFWGQVVRWMAYQRNMAEGEMMRFYYSPEQPQVRQTVALSANVMESSGEPLSDGEVTARFVAPSGRTETVRLESTGSEWGAFSGTFTPTEPGNHTVVLRCKENASELNATLFVQGARLEQVGKPARPEVLQELSRVTNGQLIAGGDIEAIIQAVRDVPEQPNQVRRIQLWSHPLAAITLVLLLGVFWIGRKMVGLF